MLHCLHSIIFFEHLVCYNCFQIMWIVCFVLTYRYLCTIAFTRGVALWQQKSRRLFFSLLDLQKPKPQASVKEYATWQEKVEVVKMGKLLIYCVILYWFMFRLRGNLTLTSKLHLLQVTNGISKFIRMG